jgi:hypothetical protein
LVLCFLATKKQESNLAPVRLPKEATKTTSQSGEIPHATPIASCHGIDARIRSGTGSRRAWLI